MANKYSNTSLNVVSTGGGANQLIIPVGTTIRGGDGADGATSIPCKEAYLQLKSGTGVRVNIGALASATAGIDVPKFGTNHNILRIPIDDLNKLYLIGTAADVVDILYRI